MPEFLLLYDLIFFYENKTAKMFGQGEPMPKFLNCWEFDFLWLFFIVKVLNVEY